MCTGEEQEAAAIGCSKELDIKKNFCPLKMVQYWSSILAQRCQAIAILGDTQKFPG